MSANEVNALIAAKTVSLDFGIAEEVIVALKEYDDNSWSVQAAKKNQDTGFFEEVYCVNNILSKRQALTMFANTQVKYFGHEIPSTEIVEKKNAKAAN